MGASLSVLIDTRTRFFHQRAMSHSPGQMFLTQESDLFACAQAPYAVDSPTITLCEGGVLFPHQVPGLDQKPRHLPQPLKDITPSSRHKPSPL
jgi:hypothetical protein